MAKVTIPTFKLNNGLDIPALGYGTWVGLNDKNEFLYEDVPKLAAAMGHALEVGYRHVDTAHIYRVEPEVGRVLRAKIQEGVVKRGDVFVTTKVWNHNHRPADVEASVRGSLQRLGLDYIDLVLMHWPMSISADGVDEKIDYVETWRGFEAVLRQGLVKSIGVSNFNVAQLTRLLANAEVVPAVNQVEINLNLGQKELVDFCQKHKILVVAYTPLGCLFRNAPSAAATKYDNPKLTRLAEKHGKTVTQIVLRYLMCDETDGGKAPRITLNDGNTMPVLGLGTFLGFDEKGQKKVEEGEVELPVMWALNAGYRMIDTASLYLNEEQVGLGVRRSGVPREHVFLVTKLGMNEQRDVVGALKRSLGRLNMTYVDLYLIHNPVAIKADGSGEFDIIDYVDTWKGMEETKRLGLAKSIGISNFNISQMERLMDNCEIKPAVLQVEGNLNLAQNKILNFTKAHNMAVMAYTPFGSLFEENTDAPPPRADNPILVGLGFKYKKTVPQIALRYLVQKGVIPIPKSIRKARIEQNIDIFDFELSDEDMERLGEFNRDYRTVWPSFWQNHPYYPFEKKDIPDPDIFQAGRQKE